MVDNIYNGYLNMLAVGIYGIELISLGTGLVSILRSHHTTDEMDLLYLLDVIKIFLITGYLIVRSCWNPADTSPSFNKIMYTAIIGTSVFVVLSTMGLTGLEVRRNLKDDNPNNDYLIYILIAACLFQSILFVLYCIYFIKYINWEIKGKGKLMESNKT